MYNMTAGLGKVSKKKLSQYKIHFVISKKKIQNNLYF